MISEEAWAARRAHLRKSGNPMVLESHPDAWYHGGMEILVSDFQGGRILQVTDWNEGVSDTIVLTSDQVVELIGRLT